MKHLVNALLRGLPRMALLAVAFVAAAAVWGMDAETTRAEDDGSGDVAWPVAFMRSLADPELLPEAGADAPIVGGINELDGDRYRVILDDGELAVRFYEQGSAAPAWTAVVPAPEFAASGQAPTLETIMLTIYSIEDEQKVFNSLSRRADGGSAEPAWQRDGSGDYVPISMTRHVDGETGALQRMEFTITETNGDRYLGTYDGGEVSVRFYMAGSEAHAWSGAAPLKADGGGSAGMGLANAITLAVHGIEEGQRIYDGPQAALARPAAERTYEPRQAAPDEGGTGVNNFDREEWYEFSILLAPFLVLVTFILILMFMWDRHSGEEG